MQEQIQELDNENLEIEEQTKGSQGLEYANREAMLE